MTQTSMQAPRQGNGLAIAGLILGIVSVFFFCISFISLLCGICGLIFSILGMRRAKITGTGRGMAIAGLVLGVAGLLLFAGRFMLIFWYADLTGWMQESWTTIRDGGAPATSPSENLPALPLLKGMLGPTGIMLN